MTEIHRELFNKESVDFAKLFYPRIKGGIDVDFLFESGGKFLIIEFKRINDGVIKVPYGQYRALRTLVSDKHKIILAGHDEDYTLFRWSLIETSGPIFGEDEKGMKIFLFNINNWKSGTLPEFKE